MSFKNAEPQMFYTLCRVLDFVSDEENSKKPKKNNKKMKFQFESFEYSIRIQSLLQPVGYQSFKRIYYKNNRKKTM
jgi:hypothetical protein